MKKLNYYYDSTRLQYKTFKKMGNTHSSMGLTFGSVIGGLIAAPFTGGASIAVVAIASATGTAVGATAFTVNALNNRDAPKGEETTSFLTGFVGGVAGPACGAAAAMGAEVSLGIELAGTGIGIGATNAGDGKPKPYVGNQQEAIKYYTQKEETSRASKYLQDEWKKDLQESSFHKGQDLCFLKLHISENIMKKVRNVSPTISSNLTWGSLFLSRLNTNGHFQQLCEYYDLCEKRGNESGKRSRKHLFDAIVYGLAAIAHLKDIDKIIESHGYSPYVHSADKDMKECASLLKRSFKELIASVKEETKLAKKREELKEKTNRAWDIKTQYQRGHEIIVMDSKKYMLTTPQKLKELEEFVNTCDDKNMYIKIYNILAN